MIELQNVVKKYGEKVAVNDLNFSVEKGKLFGFLGPNGAGKTTTIRMMIGLLRPTEGQIFINGLNVWDNPKKIHRDIGVVFELPNLYLKSSIKSNIKLFADLYGVSNDRVMEVLKELQLDEKQNEKVGKLSKGWKQRVLIARALIHDPKVLFLDEPTSGLDPNTTALIREYIKKIKQRGTTIVLTTHDMHEAEELSDCVGIMYNGQLAAIDTKDNLKQKYGKNEIYLEYKEGNEVIKVSLPADTSDTTQFVDKLMEEKRIIRMDTQEKTLAEIFAIVTGGKLS
jgi:ABC-2 type transport system ATP-binding protein